jgi:hypothetical protein
MKHTHWISLLEACGALRVASLTINRTGAIEMTVFKKLSIGILAVALALPLAFHTSYAGPSAQFAFATSELTLVKQTTGTNGWVTVLAAPIKTPASKELYVNGSLEAGLYTQTLVRSKNNKKDTSTASVAIQVRALIDGQAMPPGTVTYAARTQTLSATLEGAIAGCLSLVNNPDGTSSIILDQDCVTPEEIELILSTLNAASFNFVASNVPVGDHVVSLQARISSSTSVQEGSATAEGLVGKGSMIVQIVRATRNAAGETEMEGGAPAAAAPAAPGSASTWGRLKVIYR